MRPIRFCLATIRFTGCQIVFSGQSEAALRSVNLAYGPLDGDTGKERFPIRVDLINRVIQHVALEIKIAPIKVDRVLRRPPPRLRIIISGPKARQLGVLIINPSGEAERLEAGTRVHDNVPKFVIIRALHDRARGAVDDEPWAAEMVADDAVRHTIFEYIVGHVGFTAVHKPGHHVIVRTQLGHQL